MSTQSTCTYIITIHMLYPSLYMGIVLMVIQDFPIGKKMRINGIRTMGVFLHYFYVHLTWLWCFSVNKWVKIPSNLLLKDNIINKVDHFYQYLKQDWYLILVYLNITWINDFPPKFMLYIPIYLRNLPSLYIKHN